MSEASQLIQADPTLTALQDITSPSVVNDIGSFITSISKDPVRLNGHFCDVFEGMHSTAGRVALKRPRIGGMIGDEEATVRVGCSQSNCHYARNDENSTFAEV